MLQSEVSAEIVRVGGQPTGRVLGGGVAFTFEGTPTLTVYAWPDFRHRSGHYAEGTVLIELSGQVEDVRATVQLAEIPREKFAESFPTLRSNALAMWHAFAESNGK